MSTVLSNGVIVPDVGSTNWAADLETNWTLLNALIGAVGANVRLDRPNIWTAAQTFSEGIYGDLDGTAAMAVSDANGNEIATTYALKTDVTALQTALASKAADTDVVHKAGAETITGDKTHDADLAITGNHLFAWERPQVTRGTLPSSTVYYGTTRYRDANLNSFVLYRGSINAAGNMDYGLMMYPWVEGSTKGWSFYVSADGNDVWLRPIGDNVHLGMADHKWLSLNGINPGALSLPINTNSASFNIDTTNWTTDGSVITYTPLLGGWLYINARNDDTNGDSFIILDDGVSGFGASVFGNKGLPNKGVGLLCLMMPVNKNNYINIRIKSPGIISARLYPCNGNV